MKKGYYLWVFFALFASIFTGKAQIYSLKGLTQEQFESGGTDEWSFERHDVNAGTYTRFTTYGDQSTAVNYYDQFLTERFNLYPIFNRPQSGTQYESKRNAWFSDPGEYLYVAADYPEGTTVGNNLVYGVNYPDTLTGYEVYSISSGQNSAITFTVPEDGYYRVDMKVVRQDLWNAIGEMKVYQFFRYGGEGTAYATGKDFSYGKTQGIDPWAGGNEALYNQYLAKIPELPTVNGNSGKPFRGLPTGSTARYFYFYAKEGDKISFEADARSTGNSESTPRGAYARTKWITLDITATDQSTAEADPQFVDPYNNDPVLFLSLNELVDMAVDDVLTRDEYSNQAREALGVICDDIMIRMEAGVIKAMEIPTLIERLQRAIDVCRASVGSLKLRYTFDNTVDGVVPDLSGSGNNGTLLNNASVITLGNYKVLNLGKDNGYLDMGAGIGNVVSSMSDYTISTYYRIDTDAPFSGNGFMLFAFSTLEACGQNNGEYIFYRMPTQSYSMSAAGWGSSKSLAVDSNPVKGEWQHLVVQQVGGELSMYVNGEKIKSGEMARPMDQFTTATPYNWIGRPPFSGDNYLKQTLVYDFRLYNYAIPVNQDSIAEWNTTLAALENATNQGTGDEDYSVLESLVTLYTTIADNAVIGSEAGQYEESVVVTFKTAVAEAKEVLDAHSSSQLKIDAQVTALKAAYSAFLGAVSVETNTLAEGEYYFTVNDSLHVTNPGVAALANGQSPSMSNGGLSLTAVTSDFSQVWKLSKVTTLDPARYSIYSAMDEDGVYRHLTEGTVIQNSWGSADDNWRTYDILYNGTAYAIKNMGSSANKGYWTYDATNKKLANGASSPQFIFKFRESIGAGVEQIMDRKVSLFSANRAIGVLTETPVKVIIYPVTGMSDTKEMTVSGTQLIPVQPGLYIVKVQGQATSVDKVLVK